MNILKKGLVHKVTRLVIMFGLALTSIVEAEVQINITSKPTNFTPGQSQANAYEFTISKVNGMDADATGVAITAEFTPSTHVSSINWTCTATGSSVCSANGGTGPITAATTVDLIGSDSVTFAFTNVSINSNIFTNMNFNVTTNDGGVTDSDTALITRASLTDIDITVDDSFPTYTPGNTNIAYTVLVTNNGPSDADNIQFSDTVNTGFIITNWSCSATTGSSCSSSGAASANVNPMLDLESGDSATIIVTADYASSATANPMIYNVAASVTDSNATDTTPASASDSDNRALESNLSITVNTVVLAHTSYTPGLTDSYEIVVTNSGPSNVSGVTIIDNNISDFSSINWICAVDTGSSCTAMNTGRLNTTADIESGDSVTYTVNVGFNSSSTTNPLIYQVTATNPIGAIGTSPVNNSKSLSRDAISNLAISLTDSATTYVPGLSGIFTAVITNNGPSDVNGVSVIDTNISEFENINWTCGVVDSNSNCTDAAAMTTINTTVDLAANDSATFSINVDYFSNAKTNPLIYSITATNPMGVNGISPVTATDNDDILDRQVNLSITKSSETPNDAFFPNEPFTYIIVVTNNGPSDLGSPGDPNVQPPVAAEDGVNLTDMLDSILLDHPTECNNLDINNNIIHQPCWEY